MVSILIVLTYEKDGLICLCAQRAATVALLSKRSACN